MRQGGRPRRSRPAPAPGLRLDDRLALDARVEPILTAERLEYMAIKLILDVPLAQPLALGWGRLVNACITRGRGAELARVVTVAFPELKEDPLLQRLSQG